MNLAFSYLPIPNTQLKNIHISCTLVMVELNCEVKIKIGCASYYLFSFCSFCHINLDGSVLGIYNELAIIIMVIVQ